MKTIAISQRIDWYPDRNERRDALDQALIRFVGEAGYLPVVVPNSLVDTSKIENEAGNVGIISLLNPGVCVVLEAFLDKIQPDGIVLSGGNDVGSCLDRDITEAVLIRYAIRKNIPLLGICRGMQMLGVYMGATLENVRNHVRIRHVLSGVYNHEVNSFHDQAIVNLPADFEITATSEDSMVEGIRHKRSQLFGWMWHPERENPFNRIDIHNFREIFG